MFFIIGLFLRFFCLIIEKFFSSEGSFMLKDLDTAGDEGFEDFPINFML
jgi:hypothetical protein